MSLDAIKKKVMSNVAGELRVEVNQRHLIDKMLARYSSEFVLYRELMQNAGSNLFCKQLLIFRKLTKILLKDDAKASSVKISFECTKSRIITKKKCERIVIMNDGMAFRSQDWSRLKKIAEGNPDEQKIGAFGVGFYSLFSVCEEPFVSSGGQAMAFYWRGDQLFANHDSSVSDGPKWTTFLMDLREPLEVPELNKFSCFLANSLGFTVNLREILVCCNDQVMIHLTKQMGNTRPVDIHPKINKNSPLNMFKFKSVDMCSVLFSICRVILPAGTSPFKSLRNCRVEEDSILLQMVSGYLDVNIKKEFSAEMERITKKKPPSQTKIQMIFSRYDDIPKREISYAFNDLLQHSEQGKVFIGFRTHQTTGCLAHLAARVIPTVERESIDLAEKTLAVYNGELLSLSGTMFRILYEHEMNQIKKSYSESKLGRELLERQAAHILSHFTFRQSTPDFKVGSIIETHFLNCCSSKLSILSTHGVKPIDVVRLLSPEMTLFIKTIPSVPKLVFDYCTEFFVRAKDVTKQICDATIEDVFLELRSRNMDQDEMADLMQWWILYFTDCGDKEITPFLSNFLLLAAVRVGDSLLPLKNVRYYINPSKIPPDVDLPPSVLPYSISKKIKCEELQKFFGMWTEFTLVMWIRYIAEKPELEKDPLFNEKFWGIFSRRFLSISQDEKSTIRHLLAKKNIVPTKLGFKRPAESYLSEVTLFPDLPTVLMKNYSVKVSDKTLIELGVRDHVELQHVFDRLVNHENLDHMQLIKYLTKLMKDKKLAKTDIEKLKTTEIWIAEQPQNDPGTEFTVNVADKSPSNVQRYRAESLYTPQTHNRELGLPIIQWNKKWHSKMDEAKPTVHVAKFLIDLGLNEHPSLNNILCLASPTTALLFREKALKYFVENFKNKYSQYYDANSVDFKFLPCMEQDVYADPSECFSNAECNVMGFNVLRQDLRFQAEELGIKQHPSGKQLIDKLLDPPKSVNDARPIFNYLASRQGDFDHSDWKKLEALKFIPIHSKENSDEITHKSPRNCFFKSSEEMFSEFFPCIDFGEKANKFLEACGAKNKPTATHYAEFLVESSQIFWNRLKCTNKDEKMYATVLEIISRNLDMISDEPELLAKMKRHPILMCSTQYAGNKTKNFELDLASNIFINDKEQYRQIFNPPICPFDDTYVVSLYKKLGCRSLNEGVETTPLFDEEWAEDSVHSDDLHEIILERLPLYYHRFSDEEIQMDEDWLEKLEVKEINKITIEYTFKDTVKRQSTYASFHPNNRSKLYVACRNGDLYFPDIALALVERIHEKSQVDPSRMLVMLTSSLEDLQRMGYSIDRGIKGTMNISNLVEKSKNLPDESDDNSVSLYDNLFEAIRSCRSNSQGAINEQALLNVVESGNSAYCDIVPAQSLEYVGKEGKIEIYVAKGAPNILGTTMNKPLKSFSSLLIDIANVFGLEHNKIHIFYDRDSIAVAFNRQKTLFFSLKTYIELHYSEGSNSSIEAMSSWYLTMCHELAHNFIHEHSAGHEKYLQEFAKVFMSNFIRQILFVNRE
ncbi:3405_t:CDS:10 [Acaulospora morrowiae]|uniref:3405_t:CDS:1 n=1 Tax=Acaulospora morrowiae TaxID=94023 RepID=A0A9N8VLM8_9GLOM|nr:3405_t:CDS:10 [Acaulospora morrowiae]